MGKGRPRPADARSHLLDRRQARFRPATDPRARIEFCARTDRRVLPKGTGETAAGKGARPPEQARGADPRDAVSSHHARRSPVRHYRHPPGLVLIGGGFLSKNSVRVIPAPRAASMIAATVFHSTSGAASIRTMSFLVS